MEQELPARRNFHDQIPLITSIISFLRRYLRIIPIPTVKFRENLYRVTNDGGIEVSGDDGKTWQPSADFGGPHHIWGLKVEGDDLVAAIDYGGHIILINSEDGKVWYNHPVED
jgi:hypothetical protein